VIADAALQATPWVAVLGLLRSSLEVLQGCADAGDPRLEHIDPAVQRRRVQRRLVAAAGRLAHDDHAALGAPAEQLQLCLDPLAVLKVLATLAVVRAPFPARALRHHEALYGLGLPQQIRLPAVLQHQRAQHVLRVRGVAAAVRQRAR
jgi:hypothetical protein